MHAEHNNHFEGWRPSLQCDVAAALKTIRRKPVENAFNKKKKKKVQVSEIVATLLKFLIDYNLIITGKMEKIPTCSVHKNEGCLLYVDSASRGNPGPAAVGSVIKAHLNNDKLSMVWHAGRSIGKRTNNEAEFEALLFGLEQAHKSKFPYVVAMSDSVMLVKQFHGQYEVGSPELVSLLERAKEASKKFCGFSLRYIPSTDNMEADAQANKILDKAMPSGRLEEDSSCPVCFELFEPPVFQCPKGHLICKGCLENIFENSNNESCPECRTPYMGLKIPNVVADDRIKQWRSHNIMETPLATYKLSKNHVDIRSKPLMSSAKVGRIEGGSYVDINEIKMVSHTHMTIISGEGYLQVTGSAFKE